MADKFNEQLDRMKALMSYGQVNEDTKPVSNYSIEYRSVAANGKTYGIIRECNKFYIKTAPKGKETIAEAYDYIGGWANKTDYEYDSYPKAYKQFELKMASINEACDAKVNTGELSRFMNQELMTEATESMKNEIARQRQIMYNAGMIMNEAKDYAVKGGDACENIQPEAETGKKGDKVEGSKDSKANPEYAGSKTNGVDKKAEPFKENPSNCKDQLKEELDTDFDAGLKNFGSTTNGEADTDHNNDPFTDSVNEGECCGKCGKNPCECGVNEEDEKEWASKGLPGSAGVGEADTDHNNDPFTKNVNEEFEGDEEGDDVEGENDSTDTDFDAGLDDEFSDDDEDFSDEADDEDLGDDEDFSDDEDFEDEEGDFEDGEDFGDEEGEFEDEVDESDPESIRMEIERLQGLLDDMEGGEDELGGEDEFGDEEGFEGDDEFGDEEGFEDGDEFGGEDFEDGEGFEDEPDFGGEGEEEFPEDEEGDVEECGYNPLMEAKQRKMNQIVESVVKRIMKESKKKQKVNEDELHVFGKHPGYRKKPMELPQTGEDKNQWGRDWNDESTHTEEPFGKQIGNGDPFTQLVNAVTKDVMYQLKKGLPIEGADKKKVD